MTEIKNLLKQLNSRFLAGRRKTLVNFYDKLIEIIESEEQRGKTMKKSE